MTSAVVRGTTEHLDCSPLDEYGCRLRSSGTDEVWLSRSIVRGSTLRGQLSCFSRWPEPFDSLRSLRALDSSEGRRPRAKSAERTSRAGEGHRVRVHILSRRRVTREGGNA